MRRGSLTLSAVLLLMALTLPCHGAELSYPFPSAEAEHLLGLWFADSGYTVSRSVRDDGVAFEALKNRARGVVVIRPSSPLACRLDVLFTRNGKSDEGKLRELSAYLDAHRQRVVSTTPPAAHNAAPPVVTHHAGAVVCIEAQLGDRGVQFSGFVTAPGDNVLSTAHDLEGVDSVSVSPDGFRRLRGRVIMADFHRDLALIALESPIAPGVDLGKVRVRPDKGERVYSPGCPLGDHGRILSGVVEGPPIRSEGLPYWRIDMEVPPGSSGSPVFDRQGRLIGVVKGRYRGTDSTGFVIPVETINEFLKETNR